MNRLRSIVAAWAVALLCVNASSAQTAPDAQELLQKVSAANRDFKSGHLAGQTVMEMKGEGFLLRIELPFVLAIGKANQMRMEARIPIIGSIVTVSDGQSEWTYLSMLKQYSKQPAKKERQSDSFAQLLTNPMLNGAGFNGMLSPDFAKEIKAARVLREETIEVGGQSVPCYVVEVETPSVDLFAALAAVARGGEAPTDKPAEAEPKVESSKATLWIDKQRSLIVRRVANGGALAGLLNTFGAGGGSEYSEVTTLNVAKVNEPLPDSLFVFTPPADAKEVAELEAPFAASKRASLMGKEAPTFALKDLAGRQVDLQRFKGKVMLLDFWASWCGPCVAELPHIEKLHRDFKNKGLIVLGINDEDAATAREFVKSKGYTFTTLHDAEKTVGEQYQISAIPQLVLIGRDGKIKLHQFGYEEGGEKELRQAVEKVLRGEELTPVISDPHLAIVPPPPPPIEHGNVRLVPVKHSPADSGPMPITDVPETAAPAPKLIRVSGGVLSGSAIRKVQPSYPPEAINERVQGAVKVQVLISEDGQVIDATVLEGPAALRDVALQAARRWEFKPVELSGVPVKVQGVLTFNFTLQ